MAGIYPLVRFHGSFHPEDGQRQCLVTWRSPQLCTLGYLSRRENWLLIRSGETRSIEESVKKKKKEKREASPRSEKIMEKQNTSSAMFIALVRDTLDKRNPS